MKTEEEADTEVLRLCGLNNWVMRTGIKYNDGQQPPCNVYTAVNIGQGKIIARGNTWREVLCKILYRKPVTLH